MAGALLAASSASASASTASATQRKRHRKPPVKAAPAPVPDPIPIPLPPPPPAYPVHDPAVPPEVSYVNGQLLINAKNSTLSDVLKAVEKDTGATFDISSGDTSERVVGRIGPGTPRDVMAELLNGSHFNYVMLSPTGNPSALSKVLLTPRSKGGAGQTYTAQQQPPQTFQQPMQISPGLPIQQQVQQQNAAAEESSDNGDAADENADNQNQDQPENQPETQDASQSVQAPQQPPGVKTPEQLLQELRQQQQQVIQQQQVPQGAQPQPDDNR
jgi:hypothetical protein